MQIGRRLTFLCLLAGSACASTQAIPPQAVDAVPSDLPSDAQQLIAIIDSAAAEGPGSAEHQRALQAAESLHKNSPDSTQSHWRIARAIFYFVLGNPTRVNGSLSEKCLSHGAQAAKLQPSANTHLYHALCMGVRAQFAPTEGLGLVKSMLTAAEKVHTLKPKFEHAAGARLLGGIYLKAPAWPTSVGDGEMAIEYLEKATELAPNWPENKILLAEAYYAEDRADEALQQLQDVERLLKAMKNVSWRKYFAKQVKTLTAEITD